MLGFAVGWGNNVLNLFSTFLLQLVAHIRHPKWVL